VAYGINVPTPLADELIMAAIYESGGCAVPVADAELLHDLRTFAAAEGMLICPEGAACLSAARKLRGSGWLDPRERVVIVNTGTGIKYPDALISAAPQ
jgi:threonine synthase